MLCPVHKIQMELTAAMVYGGWLYVCPVVACQEARMPSDPSNATKPREKVIPGLGRPLQKEPDLELTAQPGNPESRLERKLLNQLRNAGLPEPLQEFEFHPTRGWRADMAYPALNLLIEVEGGIWMKGGGRHNRGRGFTEDCKKYRAANIAGWCVLRYTGDEIDSGEAAREIVQVVRFKGGSE